MNSRRSVKRVSSRLVVMLAAAAASAVAPAHAKTVKPPLHGQHWVAITGKPLAATAGARIFIQGGNAVDAACAMIAATSTMWDVLSWGGETQALIYNPHTRKVIGVNALGVAPTGATPEFYKSKGYEYPPEFGPLAAVTPGTPGGIMVMLAEYGKLSLAEVLAPAIEMADGYPIEAQTADLIEKWQDELRKWPESRRTFLIHEGKDGKPLPGYSRVGPEPGEIFRQPELAATLRKLVDAEANARKAGKNRKQAIMAAYDRFYKGDIAQEFARGSQELGGLHTPEDLANWQVHLEAPVSVNYKGIEVYKLTHWVQGPSMLQALNILENFDLKSMGYNSARYIHTLYQSMSLAFADRDFYYGDPRFPPEEPIKGLLSKEYARERAKLIKDDRNDPDIRPGDPYPFQGGTHPFKAQLDAWHTVKTGKESKPNQWSPTALAEFDRTFRLGTTTVETVDKEGWVVSVTPSGGWLPATIAGKTGIGMSQRMQSFVLDPADNPFNVVAPGKRPRATLTPSMALKDGKPYLAFAVQGGDTQEQNLLQFFLNVVEFGMTPQEAAEGANITSYQLRDSFGAHESYPGRLTLANSVPEWVRNELTRKGYKLEFTANNSGPITAIQIDARHGTFWGAAAYHGEDYGIAW